MIDVASFPKYVEIDSLEPDTIQRGDGYVVGKSKDYLYSYIKPGELVGKFEGLNTLFEYQKEFQPVPRESGASDRPRERGFNVFDRFEEARSTYVNNPSSVVDFTENDIQLEGGDAAGKDVTYDVQGDFLDVGRYLEGEPECFGSMTNGNPRSLRVSFIVDLSWSAHISHETINHRAKRLLRLADWLESQQVRTQIIAIESTDVAHLELLLKHFDEPMNLNDLGVVGHSDFLRRIIFRFDEYSPETFSSTYGRADSFRAAQRDFRLWESEYVNEYTVLVGNSAYTKDDVDAHFDVLEETLKTKLETEDPDNRVLKTL